MPNAEFYKAIVDPFGPYVDNEVLSDRCKSTPTSILQLESFALECGGRVTGLDQIESPVTRNESQASKAMQQRLRPLTLTHVDPLPPDQPIHFRGTLTVLHLNHLRPEARRCIDRELRRRLDQNGVGNPRASISKLFDATGKFEDRRHPLKIRIQGIKHLSAGYITSSLVPKGLRITSEDRTRHYEVTSMDIETYELSCTYLSRYRTLAALVQIANANKSTPVPRRTPDWFINHYVRSLPRQHPELRWRRPIFDPDLKVDKPFERYKPSDEVRKMPVGTLSLLPHEVRTVHKAEVRSVFGSHVDWIIAQLEATSKMKWLNLDSWKAWANQVKDGRRQLQEADPLALWARKDAFAGYQPPEEDVEASSVEVRLSTRRRSRASTRTRGTSSTLSGSPKPDEEEIANENEASERETFEDPVNEWDSDMSMDSSSSEPDTEPERPPSPPDPELVAVVPPQIVREPQVPLDFCWVCPIGECPYTVDLLRLTIQNTNALRPDMVLHREDGSMCLGDNNLDLGLRLIVNAHNEEHLASLGIRWVQLPDRVKPSLRWTDPSRQKAQRPNPRWLAERQRIASQRRKMDDAGYDSCHEDMLPTEGENENERLVASDDPNEEAEARAVKNSDEETGNSTGVGWVCPVAACGKQLSCKHHLNRHVLETHRNYKPHKCSKNGCGQSFKRLYKLREHMATHKRVVPSNLIGAGSTSRRSTSRKGPCPKNHSGHRCPFKYCHLTLSRKADFLAHMRNDHPGRTTLKCPVPTCQRYLPRVDYLRKHVLRHEMWEGAINPEDFEDTNALEVEIDKEASPPSVNEASLADAQDGDISGNGEDRENSRPFVPPSGASLGVISTKPFLCPFASCKRSFDRKGPLTLHKRLAHGDGKQHVCPSPGCVARFRKYTPFEHHYREVHGTELFGCPARNCGRTFTQACNMQTHVRVKHKDGKFYECVMRGCHKMFSRSDHYRMHMHRAHKG